MDVKLLVPLLIAAIAPIGAYLLAARRMSGKIDTSTATELWTEARAIRSDYREQIAQAAERTRDLELRVAKLEGQNNDLIRENIELKAKVASLEALVATLRETIDDLQAELKKERES